MNKNGNPKTKYCIQSEKHPLQTSLGLCSLMEHQSLVDIAICCGNNTLHAHKVVLAANSPLFREELEKNSCIEQVIISGCDFSVMRSIIEFMYCGETIISEDYIKYLVAAAKLFQMRSLENLSLERTDYQFAGNEVPSNVEIMFKTSDGSFVTVTDEVLQNLSTKDGLQYQVVDENGHVGEVQELQVLGRESVEKIDKIESQDMPKDLSNHNTHLSSVSNPEDYINTHFLDASQMVFNAENPISSNVTGTSGISIENSKNFNHDPSFETESTINENSKDIELLTLNSEDLKPTFLGNSHTHVNINKVNNYYEFEESNHDLKPNRPADESTLADVINISVDDKYKITGLSSLSPKKTRSSLKFSPDMFFADISTNNIDESMDEPEQKKLCLSRRKKIL